MFGTAGPAPHGRVLRRRATRAEGRRAAPTSAGRDDGALAAPPETGLSRISQLVAEHRARGLDAQFVDRTAGRPIPPELGRLVYDLAESGLAAAQANDEPGQTRRIRLRIDGDHLVFSSQTTGTTRQQSCFAADDVRRASLHRLVEDAEGVFTIRPTSGGNWLTIVRLPMHPVGVRGSVA